MGRNSGGAGRAGSGGSPATGIVREKGLPPVQYVKAPRDRNKVLVKVDVAKLNDAWKKDKGYYIPRGGGGAAVPGKREGVREYLKKGKPLEAPSVNVDRHGTASFNDGRHRFSVLRDKGYKQVYVAVDRKDAARVKKELG